jgi:hypothetical protein
MSYFRVRSASAGLLLRLPLRVLAQPPHARPLVPPAQYLDTAHARDVTALDAIRAALEGKPWLPPLPAIS